MIEHLATGATLALYLAIRSRIDRRPTWAPKAVRWWYARLCRALGVRLKIAGYAEPGCLLVGNHVSWLDIPIIGAQCETAFLSKAEVRHWPLIGWMASVAGTRFIARGAYQADAIAAQIAEDVAHGRSLTVFPEGTTTEGDDVRRFHPRLFSIAKHPGIRIQPVAIGYRRGADTAPDTAIAYIGDDTLVANLWRVICHPELVAHLHFLPPIQIDTGAPRRVLAERTRTAIVMALELGRDPCDDLRDGQRIPYTPVADRDETTLTRLDPSPV